MATELAYQLISGDSGLSEEILDGVILLLIPSLNPDGTKIVVDWYRSTLDTPYEGAAPPTLYHLYAGHDNNRDWFMISQQETKLVTDVLYKEWFPQIVYDIHQMGPNGAPVRHTALP